MNTKGFFPPVPKKRDDQTQSDWVIDVSIRVFAYSFWVVMAIGTWSGASWVDELVLSAPVEIDRVTVEPTATVDLAVVLSPTETPTVAPTATAAPTPTAAPSPTATVDPYRVLLGELAERYQNAFLTIGEQATLAGDPPADMDWDQWQTIMAAALALVRVNNAELRAASPPAYLQETHGLLLQAADRFDAGTELLAVGIDGLNGDQVEMGLVEMLAGVDLVGQAAEAAK